MAIRPARHHRIVPRLDALEGRALLTTYFVAVPGGHVALIEETQGFNDLGRAYVNGSGDTIIRDDGVDNVAPADLLAMYYSGGSGNDKFTNQTYITLLAHGGSGNDTLIGANASDRLYGDTGTDTLTPVMGAFAEQDHPNSYNPEYEYLGATDVLIFYGSDLNDSFWAASSMADNSGTLRMANSGQDITYNIGANDFVVLDGGPATDTLIQNLGMGLQLIADTP